MNELHVVFGFYFSDNTHMGDLPFLFPGRKKYQIPWLQLRDFLNFFAFQGLGIGRSR